MTQDQASPPDGAHGSLGLAVVDPDRLGDGLRLLFLDSDLMDRVGLRRALDLPSGAYTDAALILRAYDRWGMACADRLCGAFAFVLWDGNQRAVLGARDPVGIAPFAYAVLGHRLIVSGDPRRLLEVEGVSDALDEDVLAATLLSVDFNGVMLGRTCLRDVRTLPPGHTLRFQDGAVRTDRYWHPAAVPAVRFSSPDGYVEAFRDRLEQVVTEYATADEPLGVHVTGGIDSAACVAVASRVSKARGEAPPVGFSWLAPTPGADEWERTEITAQYAGIPLVPVPLTVEGALAVLGRDATRDPYTSTLLHEAEVQKAAAAQGIRVMLSGWGGDEATTFGGRGTAERYLARRGQWLQLYRSARARGRSGRRAITNPLFHPKSLKNRRLETLRRTTLRGERTCYVDPGRLRAATLPVVAPLDDSGPIQYMESLLLNGHLAERAVAWAISGAEHGLRYRYPLLDRRLLAFPLGMPAALFLPQDGEHRWLMRRALRGWIPERVRVEMSKQEVARYEATNTVLEQALGRMGEMLRERPMLSGRMNWFDRARLMGALAPDGLAEHRQLSRLVHALVYLDALAPA